jgi:hypothetical protein
MTMGLPGVASLPIGPIFIHLRPKNCTVANSSLAWGAPPPSLAYGVLVVPLDWRPRTAHESSLTRELDETVTIGASDAGGLVHQAASVSSSDNQRIEIPG